jgi:UDP-glucose 4-epimerase
MPQCENPRCLVTGASGPLGAALVGLLLARRYAVAVVVRPSSDLFRLSNLLDRISVFRTSLRAIDDLESCIRDFAPDIVFHLAWEGTGRGERDSPIHITLNLPASIRLLEISIRSGVKSWIGVGSQAEYGPRTGPVQESHDTVPTDTYGLAKLCLGQLALARGRLAGISVAWLRVFSLYGPKDDERRFVPYLIQTLLSGKPPRINAGERRWDYLYFEDAARALIRTAETRISGIYNLASGDAVALSQVAELLRDSIDPDLALCYDVTPVPPDLIADISRFTEATGWHPEVSITDGMRRTVQWYDKWFHTVQATSEHLAAPVTRSDR